MRYFKFNLKLTRVFGLISIMLMSILVFALPVKAEGDFVVCDIASDGTITDINTFSNFAEAKSTMLTYPNGIITHNASLSPTKIIAMTKGVAVSYTFRYGVLSDSGYSTDRTMIITQYETTIENQKNTYIGSHYDMQYIQTTSYDPNSGNGKVNVVVSGFQGFVDLHQVDLVPMVYLENNLPITLGGNTFDPTYEAPFVLTSPKQLQFSVVNDELIFERWSFYSGDKRNNVAIGPKASWMQNGDVYYSYDFNNYYRDRMLTDLAGSYYNYYQYLPLRSKSNITAEQLNNYLLTKKDSGLMINNGQLFLNAQDTYGVNALLLYAIACQESNYGTSDIALRTNNLFGINAIDSDPSQATTFLNVESCINDMSGWFLRRYMDINDWRFFGSHLGSKESGFNVKYASDPYWGIQIAAIAYSIDKANTLVDHEYYSYGVINDYNVDIKKLPDLTADKWYSSAYGATYQEDFMVILNHLDNNFYQIPATNPIENATLTTLETARRNYDFLESIGYVDASKITLINESRYIETTSNNPVTKVVYPEYIIDGNIMALSSFTFDTDGLDLSGHVFNKGVAVRDLSNVDHTLVFKDTTTKEETVFTLDDGVTDPNIDITYPIKDLSFTAATFTGLNIDLSTLANGEYEVLIRTAYDRYLNPFDINIDLETIPDVSTITQSLVFNETDNKLYITVNKVIEGELATSISTFEWGTEDHNNELFIEGVAAIRGINHYNKDLIQHKLIIYNVENNTEYMFDLTTYSGDELGTYNVDLYDGYNYYYVWFSDYIDISTLPEGSYRAKLIVEVTSDDGYSKYVGDVTLRNNLLGNIPSIKSFGENSIVIYKNGKEKSRYELYVIKGLQDLHTSISKPTSRITYTSLSELSLNQDLILNIRGAMYLYRVDHSIDNSPTFKLYFVKDGQVVKDVVLNTTTGDYDITPMVNSGNDYSYAWYELNNIDVSSLEVGTYKIYISESLNDFFEIIRLYDIYNRFNFEIIKENLKYEFVINTNEYYYISLIISDYEPEQVSG
ncbi:MAG: glucosaminidase domain-containing protein [Erysipelotrichaceae bacterium]|nr:glucosaminidase domain-containing protein [Erysipelotrichaceae bacterium]